MRHPTRAAIDRLSDSFGLVLYPYMQDWEIECADPNRVGEFLDFYAAGTSDDDERFTLMALILGSFEVYHGLHEPDSVLWERIRSVLAADIDLHRDQIEYYQCLDAESEEEYFPITKLIRQIDIPTRPEGADGRRSVWFIWICLVLPALLIAFALWQVFHEQWGWMGALVVLGPLLLRNLKQRTSTEPPPC